MGEEREGPEGDQQCWPGLRGPEACSLRKDTSSHWDHGEQLQGNEPSRAHSRHLRNGWGMGKQEDSGGILFYFLKVYWSEEGMQKDYSS